MKLTRLFLALAIALCVVACDNSEKKTQDTQEATEEVAQGTDDKDLITKANNHIAYEEYVEAANAITQIAPERYAQYVLEKSPLLLEISQPIILIEKSNDEEAKNILKSWSEEIIVALEKIAPTGTPE